MLPRATRAGVGIQDDETGPLVRSGRVAATTKVIGGGEPRLARPDHDDVDRFGFHAGCQRRSLFW